MGFFYLNTRKEKTKRTTTHSRSPSKSNQHNVAVLNRLGCKACPLNNAKVATPKMQPSIPSNTLIYFLSESPTKDDDLEGKPLSGDEGDVLRQCIPPKYLKRCAFDNTVRDMLPTGKQVSWVEMECCRNNVIKSIEEAKPKLVVGLGLVPLQWALRSGDLTGMRGRIFAVKFGEHACWFMPTYHPSFVLRAAWDNEKPLNSRMGHCFRMDIEKALKSFRMLGEPTIFTVDEAKENIDCYDGTDRKHLKAVLAHLKAARKSRKVALDWETYPLRPYSTGAEVVCCGISYRTPDTEEQRTFSFAVDSSQSGWNKDDHATILKALKRLLKDKNCLKIAQNTAFEIEWAIHLLGLDVVEHTSWEDTMAQAHIIDERRGAREDGRATSYQNLAFLTQQYLGINIKNLFQLDMKDVRKNELPEVLLYNGVDAKFTLLLHEKQEQIIQEKGLMETYLETTQRQPTVAIMQHLGMPVNQQITKKYQAKLGSQLEKINEKINNLKVVQQFIKDNGKFNPRSDQDLIKIFDKYLKRTEIKVLKKNSRDDYRMSTDESVLTKIDHPLAEYLLELRNYTKLKSTYIDPFVLGEGSQIYPDGKIHTSFNTTFTTTGRLSSDSPNFQNFPKRKDLWVRRQVVAPEGKVIISADYGQLEWCLACCCCKDKAMVKATWEGYDVHQEWAEKIAHQYPAVIGGKENIKDKALLKKLRSKVKNKFVFPSIFGASRESVAAYMSMPIDEIEILMDEFWSTFYGLASWQKKLLKNYYEVGYVETPQGRRRHYPMTKSEAINAPIQGGAAEVVCDSMCRLSRMAHENDFYDLHPILNIHDDLTFVVEDDDETIEEAIKIIYTEMLDIPYDWINVPMSVEVSVGYNWEQMEEVGKFFSHKDL